MRKARLIVTWQCNKNCAGCCNKALPVEPIKIPEEEFLALCQAESFDEVIITGGEPLLFPRRLKKFIKQIPTPLKTILYTAEPYPVSGVRTREDANLLFQKLDVLDFFNGVTITLHDKDDVGRLEGLMNQWSWREPREMTLRINIFDEISLRDSLIKELKSKYQAEISNKIWIQNCPMPKDEILYVLDKPWKKTMEDKCQQ